MTSFGVDQALWLARRLGMDRRFFPTNEGLEGLAVLSNVEIVSDDGYLLPSTGEQTGLQRVQIRPDAGVLNIYNTWLGLLLDMPGERAISDQEQDQERQLRTRSDRIPARSACRDGCRKYDQHGSEVCRWTSDHRDQSSDAGRRVGRNA